MNENGITEFERALDDCLDRISRGESTESCLALHAGHAKELEPLLLAGGRVKDAYSFIPSADAKRAARQRFHAALEKKSQRSFLQTVLAHRAAWAAVAAAFALLFVGYLSLRNVVAPGVPPPIAIAAPDHNGNFAFLMSDEVNAIGDFTSLQIGVNKVGLLKDDGSGQWVEFVPEITSFDLTLLPGEKTLELWHGDVPEGAYAGATVYVNNVQGVLAAGGQVIQLKVPSNKLQLSKPFEVTAEQVTSFTYDLSVVHAGNAQGGLKYLLKPQIDQSGATLIPKSTNTTAPSNPGNGRAR